ncbi:MAG: hypothetical protein IKM61_07670 [Eubacteriaceae bacterium]|nr:hypothetical protein [Eubacteriaceae bacterium]
MRKLIAILISFMLLFTVAACFGKDDGKDNMNNNNNNGSSQGGSYNDGTNGGGSGGNMNGGSMNGGGMNNGSMNNGSMDSVEDLTDAERETLRSQIDSTHGLTFGDIRFEGTKAMITLKDVTEEIGDDVRNSIRDMVRSIRGSVTDVEILK